MAATEERRPWLEAARIYLVTEAASARDVLPAALNEGVDVVQLRDKAASDHELLTAAEELRGPCASHGALLIVNDRADLAVASNADGVHVGQDDDPPAAVRERVGPALLIGLSTHSPAQVDEADENDLVDYLGVGPIYETATKPGLTPVGLDLVSYAAAHARKPWFAIGGIDTDRAAEVAEAGAERIAVVRAIRDAPDPGGAARALRAALERAQVGG